MGTAIRLPRMSNSGYRKRRRSSRRRCGVSVTIWRVRQAISALRREHRDAAALPHRNTCASAEEDPEIGPKQQRPPPGTYAAGSAAAAEPRAKQLTGTRENEHRREGDGRKELRERAREHGP